MHTLLPSVKIWYHFYKYLRSHTYWGCHDDSKFGEGTFPVLLFALQSLASLSPYFWSVVATECVP